MGLDLTLYMAKRTSNEDAQTLEYLRQFAPDPPKDTDWEEFAYWRKHYPLAQALFPNHGSPDWVVLTIKDIDRALQAMQANGWSAPDRYPDQATSAVLRIVRDWMIAGRTFMCAVCL